jgi:hypothetical protein
MVKKYANYFNNINFDFYKKHHLKIRIIKIITAIVVFVLIFDKATILFITYIYYKYTNWHNKWNSKCKENYTNNNNNNNALESVIFEPSNNTIALMSKVFKHPELNYKSYNNVKIDPTKVLFEENKFLPECCFYNSEYSSSKGCPCITSDQQYYLNMRGTNKSYMSVIQTNNDYKNKYFSPTLAFQGETDPFNAHDTKFITGYEPLSAEKKNEFNSLINLY